MTNEFDRLNSRGRPKVRPVEKRPGRLLRLNRVRAKVRQVGKRPGPRLLRLISVRGTDRPGGERPPSLRRSLRYGILYFAYMYYSLIT